MRKTTSILVGLLLSIGIVTSAESHVIKGAGATFPEPLFKEMFKEYTRVKGQKISYEAHGSGRGLEELKKKTVQFASIDLTPDTDPLLSYIPITIEAVSIIYNLPGNPELKLTPEILAAIFSGKITHWNAKEIQKLNPEITLLNLPIQVFNRASDSGTSYLFLDYLTNGTNKKALSLVGTQVESSEEICGKVAVTVGGIGYASLHQAIKQNITYASLRNKKGHYVIPTVDTILLAATTEAAKKSPYKLTNTSAEYGYPICGLSWLVIYKKQDKKMLELLKWMTQEGQLLSEENAYPPLPENIIRLAKTRINAITKLR